MCISVETSAKAKASLNHSILVKMDSFQIVPLNLTQTPSIESVKSIRDLCKDCNSEYCVVKKYQEYQIEEDIARLYHHFTCELCKKSFKTSTLLKNHQNIDHKSFCSEYIEYALGNQHQQQLQANGKSFKCVDCRKRFSYKSSLSAHRRIHKAPDSKFQCNCCGKHFKWKSNLIAHLAIHELQKFICDLCKKTYDTLDRLEDHRKNHNNLTNQCRYCEKAFSNRYKVNYHIRQKHHNIAPWQCQFCSESFATATKFRSHIYEIHDASKPFACEKCDRTFLTKRNLDIHGEKHTNDDKRFKCDYCGHQFAYKRNLYTHIMRYHQQNKDSNNRNSMRKQRPNNVDHARYFCKHCNRSFVYRKSALNCAHDARYFRNQINTGFNNANIENQNDGKMDTGYGMKVKISLVTENRANQVIPLYELNIPNSDLTSTPIDVRNEKPIQNSENEDIERVILVQAFTSPVISMNSTTNDSINRIAIGNDSNHIVDPFKTFCKSIAPEVIIINDSSSDEDF